MQTTIDGQERLVTRTVNQALEEICRSKPELFREKDLDGILIEYLAVCEGVRIPKPSRSFDSILRIIRGFINTQNN